jgi:hypothetical protein
MERLISSSIGISRMLALPSSMFSMIFSIHPVPEKDV